MRLVNGRTPEQWQAYDRGHLWSRPRSRCCSFCSGSPGTGPGRASACCGVPEAAAAAVPPATLALADGDRGARGHADARPHARPGLRRGARHRGAVRDQQRRADGRGPGPARPPRPRAGASGRFEVAGHTDSSGTDAVNVPLSEARARAVVDHLVSRGIPRLGPHGAGLRLLEAVADNATAEGRARNRRVEFRRSSASAGGARVGAPPVSPRRERGHVRRGPAVYTARRTFRGQEESADDASSWSCVSARRQRWRFAACGGSSGSSPTPVPSATPPSASCAAGAPVAGIPALTARLVASGLRNPLDLQAAPGDRERLYVVEQGGRIRVIRNGQLQPTPFLDISGRISSGGERGLLGLAFHPQFATNRRFFVNYTNPRRRHPRRRVPRDAPPTRRTRQRARRSSSEAQPFANHNGGGLAFDNDGRLLIGLGDGGSGGDPLGNGQSLDTFLGKILRIDVDAGDAVRRAGRQPVPRHGRGARPRSGPTACATRSASPSTAPTGDLYIGDVGQSRGRGDRRRARVAPRAARTTAGTSWRARSASAPRAAATAPGSSPPVYEYTHAEGCSVTGGVVYRGCRMPDLAGTYFFGDYCSGFVRSFRFASGQATDVRDWTAGLRGIDSPASFGLDAEGEVYVVDLDGEVYRLEPAS